MKTLFITSEKPPRLRLLWRLLGFVALVLFVTVLLAIPYGIALANRWLPASFFLDNALSALAITGAVLLARRLLDRRSIASLGLDWRRGQPGRDLFTGIAIAGVLMGLLFVGFRAAGWLEVVGPGWGTDDPEAMLRAAAVWGMVFVGVGFYEELLARGYLFQNLEAGLNTVWAVLLSSAVFGLLHIGNPNASPLAALGILGAGLLFALAYLRTRALWLPIGLHIGWNFFEGVVFGFPVSGLETARLVETRISGPELWTGGAFGPEAGLALLPALLAGGLWVWYYTRNHAPQSVLPDMASKAK